MPLVVTQIFSSHTCRNCLSRWYREAAEERGVGMPDPAAREIVYGMPYDQWKAKYQKEAAPAQKQAAASHTHKHRVAG